MFGLPFSFFKGKPLHINVGVFLSILSLAGGMASGALDAKGLLDVIDEKSGTRDNAAAEDELSVKEKADRRQMRAALAELLKLAVKKRDVNVKDKKGRTLLMLVAGMGNDHATEMLLAEHPSLGIEDASGHVALDYERKAGGSALADHLYGLWKAAFLAMDEGEIMHLLNCGASPDWIVDGEAPLGLAMRAGKEDLFQTLLLLFKANGSTTMKNGASLVEEALRLHKVNEFVSLTAQNPEAGLAVSSGLPVCALLLEGKDAELLGMWFDIMEDAGIACLPDGTGILCYIVRCASPEGVVMAAGNQPSALNREDALGNLPLHEAARRGDVALYRKLVELGANPRRINKNGETLLMHAACSGQSDMVAEVLRGMPEKQMKAKDAQGRTAMDYARLSKSGEVEKLLMGSIGR